MNLIHIQPGSDKHSKRTSFSIRKSIEVLLEILVELEVNAALNHRDEAFIGFLLQQIGQFEKDRVAPMVPKTIDGDRTGN